MPGLHIYCQTDGQPGRKTDLALRAAESLLHEPWFKLKTLLSSGGIFLAATYHPAYPVVTFENEEFFICMEGRIYGVSESAMDSKLSELAGSLYPGGTPCLPKSLGRVSSWVRGIDGEFVIAVVHRDSGHVSVLNDSLGRLPLYTHLRADGISISRDIRFITSMIGDVEMDRMRIAHYLMLGFMPGGGSFVRGVERLPGGSLVRAWRRGEAGGPGTSGRGISIERLRRTDFSIRRNIGKDIDICASDMVDIFRDASASRASGTGADVLAMSGGLDSRCVAAALSAQGVDLKGATFLDRFGTADADAGVARRIAGILGIPWRLFELGPATGSDALRLLRAKSGDNFLGMSFSVPLFDRIRAEYGPAVTYFTGEGGGLTVADSRPYMKIAGEDGLVSHILERNCILPPEHVSEITGIAEEEISGSIASIVSAYPEQDPSGKYVHFIVGERDMRWTFDAEDRNRAWFWTVSPFQSFPFFDYVMNCSDEMKSDYRLYRKFLLRLSPEVAAVRNVNWNLPIDGRLYRLYLRGRRLYYRMPPAVKRLVRRRMKTAADVVGPYPPDSALMRCFSEQVAACPEIGDILSVSWIENLMPSMSKYGFDHVFTVTSLIEDFLTGSTTLERYSGEGLI